MLQTVIIIPARGGSKRLPDKNIAPVWKRPMIYWPLVAAESVVGRDNVFVTTDSAKVASVVESFGFNVIDRPTRLAADDVPKMAAIRHAYDEISRVTSYDVIISLQANSPQVTGHHLREALLLFELHGRDELFSVGPDLMQNAAFRIIRAGHLMRHHDLSVNCGVYVCDVVDVHEQSDIDGLEDEPS